MIKVKKTHLRLIVSLQLVHLFLGVSSAVAQSMDDTIKFLEAYADDLQRVKVEDCIATIWISSADGKAREIVRLKAINPTTISPPVQKDMWVKSSGEHRGVYVVEFKTVNKEKAITIEEWNADGSHSLPSDYSQGGLLVGKTPELAKRLHRAFEHLVRLCGGREEPF